MHSNHLHSRIPLRCRCRARVRVTKCATDLTTYQRDGFGRVVRKTQNLAPFTATAAKSISYTYAVSSTGAGSGAGQLASITYPNATKLSYLFSPAGQITQINWGANPLVRSITYTPLGQPASWVWEFADTSATTLLPASRSYDTAGRVVQTELGSYTYDAAGRITSLTQQLYKPTDTNTKNSGVTATIATYSIGYDSLGRIASFSRAGSSGAASTAPLPTQTAVFTYDANGNRQTSLQTTGSGSTAQNTARSYQIDAASNRLQGFTQTLSSGTATTGASSSVLYTLDANGSMLKDGLRSYEFDAANRLANATTGTGPNAPTTRYVHNALGQRLFKTEPLFAPVASSANPADPAVALILANFAASLWGGSSTVAAPTAAEKLGFQYFYDEDGSLLSEMGTGGTQSTGSTHYIYLPTPSGPMPIALLVNATQYAVHTDHLNTPRRLTLANKTVAWQWAFSAFGDEQPTTAKNRFVDLTTSASLGTTNVADVALNLRYPGQYFDKESNLHFNWMRSYSPNNGRYTQADPIDLQGGWNKFGYAEGNPLLITDPNGLQATTIPAPLGFPITVPNPIWTILTAPLLLTGDTSQTSGCECYPASQANVDLVLANSTMRTYQPTVSATVLSAYIGTIKTGAPLPPINLNGNAIVDGNHRYIASLLCRKPPITRPWPGPLTLPSMPITNIVVQP
jgi:RHS repeat-associated protein